MHANCGYQIPTIVPFRLLWLIPSYPDTDTITMPVPHLFSMLHDLFSNLLLKKGVSPTFSQEQH